MKEIAHELHLSIRTVEDHKYHPMTDACTPGSRDAACELAGSEVTSPVECDAYSDRIHAVQVRARCAGRIDDASPVRHVHTAEELQDQLGALRRIE